MFKHIGTISFGFILAYIPDICNFWMNSFERCAPGCYSCCCCLHKCMCQRLSKYCHSETVLQGLTFIDANQEIYSLRRKTKNMVSELYMMGNFYMTLGKLLVVLFAAVICYILMLETNANLFEKVINMVPPLIVTHLLIIGNSNCLIRNSHSFLQYFRPCWRYDCANVYS